MFLCILICYSAFGSNVYRMFAQIKIRVKILSGSLCGAVAAEAKRVQSSWVILDRY